MKPMSSTVTNSHTIRGQNKCPAGYVTRNMIKDHTGLNEFQIKQLESRGIIKATHKNSYGWALYPESVLSELSGRPIPNTSKTVSIKSLNKNQNSIKNEPKAIYNRKEAKLVFQLLKEGKSLIDIVIDAEIHPESIKTLLHEYEEFSRTIILSKETVDEINNLPIDGELPVSNEHQIYQLLKCLSEEKKCAKCNQKPRGLCTSCAKNSILKMLEKQAIRYAEQQNKNTVEDTESSTEKSNNDD